MGVRLSIDTTLLIDVQREHRRREKGPAHRFLRAQPKLRLHLPVVAYGEFAEGFADPEHAMLTLVRQSHVLLPVDEVVAQHYSRITRQLRAAGRLIGSNDLWIAATALRHKLPLVTANVAHFRRIEGLEVVAYR